MPPLALAQLQQLYGRFREQYAFAIQVLGLDPALPYNLDLTTGAITLPSDQVPM
jgi:hypothetical protein